MRSEHCWLCGKESELRKSHVIPKFVFRWLVETGGTPYLRAGANPNKRVQDGDKHYLYCSDCETRLSKWERNAQQKIFTPATKGEEIAKKYGPWLSRFACSLALRTIQSQFYRGIESKYDQTSKNRIAEAERVWKQFLMGNRRHPGDYQQYFLHLGYFDGFDASDLPDNWNTWVNRSVERDTIYTTNGGFLATFVKLGPVIFLGKIHDSKQILGKGFLRCSEGTLTAPTSLINATTWQLFKDRARSAKDIIDSLSDKQKSVVEKQIMKDPDRFVDPDSTRFLLRDFEQFGKT